MTLLEREPAEGLQVARKAVLKTARLVLRAPRPDDAKAIKALISDRRVSENMATIPHPYTLKDARSFIANAAGKPLFVITRDDGRLIGGGGIGLRPRGYEIGYWIGVPYWGNGYATEAARALVDHAFRDLDLTELLAGARVTNPASRRVLEKCGFQWTGVGLYRINAIKSSAPIDRFRLERGIWQAIKGWGRSKRMQ
jgi:RimJ/RimL family protein N-acetyltransferase